MGSLAGIDHEAVSAWFLENVGGVVPPLHFSLIAGGLSNLSYEVADSEGSRYVLRRPPTGHVLPKAHDMAREHRIISALGPMGIPVPPALGLCQDESVTGAPFYVMGFVEGIVARTPQAAEALLSAEARRRAGRSLVETLAHIHEVDLAATDLADLAPQQDYVARQLKRWYANYLAASRSRGSHPSEDVREVHDFLAARIPEQGPAAVVHGDFRLDNCILSPRGEVVAVLDWELCTLGDPLADLGQLLAYWREPGESHPMGDLPTSAAHFPTRNEIVELYFRATGREPVNVEYYLALAYWRLACIMEGVYTRYSAGVMGDSNFDLDSNLETVAQLASRARELTQSLGS